MQTNIYASNGVGTHDLSAWDGEESSCLRPRSRCDRQFEVLPLHFAVGNDGNYENLQSG
jgi:hypothetical protein